MTNYNSKQRLLAVLLALVTIFSMLGISASAASKIKITKCDFSYNESQTYTGSAIKPAMTVKYNGSKLTKGTDYTLTFANNKNIGTGKITVTGKGKYTGTATFYFSIKLGAPKVTASVSGTKAKLSWAKVTGATKYIIYRKVAGASSYSKITSVTTKSYTASLTAGKTYYFIVAAYNSKGSTKSSAVKIVAKLAAPTTVKATPASTSSVTLKWSKVSGATGYKIYSYVDATKKYTVIKTISSASTLTFTKTGLATGTTYAYAVAAYNANGVGTKSSVTYASTKPAQVTGLKASSVTSSTAVLKWTAISGVTGYIVYKYNTSTKAWTKAATVTTNSATITGLTGSTKYYYSVAAYRKAGSTTAIGAKATKVSFTTAEANYLNDFLSIINAGKFKVKYTVVLDDSTVTGVSIVNGTTAATTMNTTIEGLSMKMNTVYYGSKKSGYVYATAMGFMKIYQKIDEALAEENALDADSQSKMFAPSLNSSVAPTTGTATISGKSCTTYSCLTTGGSRITYYFNGSKLIRIVSGSTTMNITSYTSSVSASDYALPKNFPTGYIQMDVLDS